MDDTILTASSDRLHQSIMSQLSSKYAMKDLGPLSYFLGIFVSRNSAGLFLFQQKYATLILDKASMSQCKPAPTHVTISGKLCANASSPYDNPTLYRSLAAALQYLTFTRLDISFAVQQVCLFMHDSRVEHMAALHHILRYVQGTIDHGLQLYKSLVLPLCHILMLIRVVVLTSVVPLLVSVFFLVII